MMLKSDKQIPMINKIPLLPPNDGNHSDSDSELVQELEAKRLSIDEEILRFRSEKEKEFREFEQSVRINRKRKQARGTSRQSEKDLACMNTDRSKRTSSSSALDLLAGRGASRPISKTGSSSQVSQTSHHTRNKSLSPKTGPSLSKPTLSLDPLTIKGETLSPSQSHRPSTPTLLTQTLSNNSSPISSSTDQTSRPESGRVPSKEPADTFLGILTPTYLPLLEPSSDSGTSSVLVSDTLTIVKGADEVISSLKSAPDNVLPLQSSSFPPRVILAVPASPTTKRSYTAPAATRMPSALRSASVGNLGKKRKHVTFRLADSAIVDPSSSYEEGPSPDQKTSRSKSTSAVSHSSRRANPLRFSNVSPRNGLIGDHTRSDQEDEAAGVKPGMSMDEVMQKLNAQLDLEDHEDVGWTDTKYHEGDSDDEFSMDGRPRNQEDHNSDEEAQDENDEKDDENDDNNDSETYDEEQEAETEFAFASESDDEESDSYFSPKQHEMPTTPFARPMSRKPEPSAPTSRDRSGSSPLTPFRDQNWDALSSSDKDRLLFAGRGSDSESDKRQRSRGQSRISPNAEMQKGGLSGLKKTNSTNSLASLSSLNKPGMSPSKKGQQAPQTGRNTKLPRFNDDLGPSIDGGSSIGFFELDEELDSLPAGRGSISADTENDFEADHDQDSHHGSRRSLRAEAIKSEILGTGSASVPIDIVRPSASVSSSWVGTFGH